jgi:hypothetical protein
MTANVDVRRDCAEPFVVDDTIFTLQISVNKGPRMASVAGIALICITTQLPRCCSLTTYPGAHGIAHVSTG